jgi:hypothetical protein
MFDLISKGAFLALSFDYSQGKELAGNIPIWLYLNAL